MKYTFAALQVILQHRLARTLGEIWRLFTAIFAIVGMIGVAGILWYLIAEIAFGGMATMIDLIR